MDPFLYNQHNKGSNTFDVPTFYQKISQNIYIYFV